MVEIFLRHSGPILSTEFYCYVKEFSVYNVNKS